MSGTTASEWQGRKSEGDESPDGLLTLFVELVRMQFTVMVRYRLNFVGQLGGGFLFFIVLFFGGTLAAGAAGISGSAMGPTLDGFIVGWFTYLVAQSAYSSLPGDITKESEWGTLEQLYMSPYGFGKVMTAKIFVSIIQSLVIGMTLLGAALLVTQRSLAVDLLTVVPVLLLGILSVVGIGYAVAGLALIYKRVSSFFQYMQFAIVGLVAAPVAGVPWLRLLPLVQSSSMLQSAMRRGTRLWNFPLFDFVVLVVVASVYLLLGYAVFVYCSKVARKRGVMGHY